MPLISSLGSLNATGFGFSNNKEKLQFVLVATGTSPYIVAAKWSSAGWGTRYAGATGVNGALGSACFNIDNSVVGIAGSQTANITANAFSSVSAFGTKYADQATQMGAQGTDVKFLNDNSAVIAGGYNVSGKNTGAWQWSSAGWGTKYTNPTPALPNVNRLATDMTSSIVVFGCSATSFVYVYNWSSSGFGTKITNPGTIPALSVKSVGFNNSNTVLWFTNSTGQGSIYSWSSSGFGTKYTSAPSAIGVVAGMSFSPNKAVVAFHTETAPYDCAFVWDDTTGIGTKYTNPTTNTTAIGYSSFNYSGNSLAVGYGSALAVYPFSSNGFGARVVLSGGATTSQSSLTFSN